MSWTAVVFIYLYFFGEFGVLTLKEREKKFVLVINESQYGEL